MDVVSEQVAVYLPAYRRRRRRAHTALLVLSSWAVVYWVERQTGVLGYVWKYIVRALKSVLAAWLEDASGTSLFTLEGDEPPDVDPTSYFPDVSRGSRHRAALTNNAALQCTDSVPAASPRPGAPVSARTTWPGARHQMGSSPASAASTRETAKDLDVPQFLLSTKFFACLELDDSRKVAEATTTVALEPHSLLFSAGDDGSSGIFVVVEGCLGMFLADGDGLLQTNTLMPGESVGDLDVIDGAKRSITCMALHEGAVVVQLSREVFVAFLAERPKALQIYLEQGVARLWRVANFILSDYLDLELPGGGPSFSATGEAPGASRYGAARWVHGRASPGMPAAAGGPMWGHAPVDLPDPSAPVPGGGRAANARRAQPSQPASQCVGFDARRAATSPPMLANKSHSLTDLTHAAATRDAALGRSPGGAAGESDAAEPSSPSTLGAPAGRSSEASGTLADSATPFQECPEPASEGSFWSAASEAAPSGSEHSGSLGSVTLPAESFTPACPAEDPIAGARPVPVPRMGSSAELAHSEACASTEDVTLSAGGITAAAARASEGVNGAAPADPQLHDNELEAASRTASPAHRSRTSAAPPGAPPSRASGEMFTMTDVEPAGAAGWRSPTAPGIADDETVALLHSKLRSPDTSDVPTSPMPSAARPLSDGQEDFSRVSTSLPAHALRANGSEPLPWGRQGSMSGAYASGMVYVNEGHGNKAKLHPLDQLNPPEHDASCGCGWDVVEPAAANLRPSTVQTLLAHANTCVTLVTPSFKSKFCCRSVTLVKGTTLIPRGKAPGQLILLLDGTASCHRPPRGHSTAPEQTATAHPGCVLGAASFLCSAGSRDHITAASTCHVLAVCMHELQNLLEASASAYLDLLFAGSKALAYCIRKFVSLGLNRVWLRAGDVAYKQGERAESMHVVISGRLRLVSQTRKSQALHVDEEVGRGETIGAVWAVTSGKHDTSAVAVRGCELVRLSRGSFEVISRTAPEAAARVLSDMANRMVCAHHSRNRSFQSLRRVAAAGIGTSGGYVAPPPKAGSLSMPEGSKRRVQQGDIVTIAFVAVGGPAPGVPPPSKTVHRLSGALRKTLARNEGSCLTLDWSMVKSMQPHAAERMRVPFYRTKLNSWMAAFEETYRFILLEADPSESKHWADLCIEQADCVLLVAPEGAACDVTAAEYETVWQKMMPRHVPLGGDARASSSLSRLPQQEGEEKSKLCRMDMTALATMDSSLGAAFTAESEHESEGATTFDDIDKHSWLRSVRRVELVLLHDDSSTTPTDTLEWLRLRPYLTRHHHVRLGMRSDVARLRRWVSGKAVGLVLSGGGSRGLAHLGVLRAIDDVGVPIDVVGGTSQGAFMAALFAQGLPREQLLRRVREYATQMASPRHLLSDVTLPILSLFSGRQFDKVLQETFSAGAQMIEDLWLPFFCVSTNLSKSQVQVHQLGPLWQLVRASMTIVGMVPPVIRDGDMLVDGGYLNNMPVDVMHSLGVHTVLVVDVEDKQSGAWHSLTPYDGGLSGWRLLWDRICPIPSLRFGGAVPRYRELVNALSWIAHSQNLRRMCQDYRVDLYLRPPNIGAYKLMDFHLIDRIVRASYLYAWGALSEWVQHVSPRLGGARHAGSQRTNSIDEPSGARRAHSVSLDPARSWGSVACMEQLQAKHPAHEKSQAPQQTPKGAWIVRAPPSQANARRQTADAASPLPTVPLSPGAHGALHAPPASNHSLSGESLMDAVLPAPGEATATRIMQSELMRLTARTAKAAQQPRSPSTPAAGVAAVAPLPGAAEGAAAARSVAGAASHSTAAERRAEGAAVQAAVQALTAAAAKPVSSVAGHATPPQTAAEAQSGTPDAENGRRAAASSSLGAANSKRRRNSSLTQLPELLPSLAVFGDGTKGPEDAPSARVGREEARSRDDGGSPGHAGPNEAGDGMPRRRTSRSLGSSYLQTIAEAAVDEPEDLGC